MAYTYDTLNRLTLAQTTAASDAVTPGWGQQFGYDGFGNLLSKTPTKGSAPSMSLGIDPATNRVVGTQYDANGNQLSVNLSGYGILNATYDYDNRLQAAGSFLAYAYAPDNKRIYKRNSHIDQFGNVIVDNEELYYYSPTGQKLGTYQIVASSPPSSPAMTLVVTGTKVWFGARPLNGVPDRLGSFGKYYPYGEDKGSSNPPNGTEKFATYTRDSETSLDYADQRYYSSTLGRFMSPDPYIAMATSPSNPANPQSWNRYAYVLGDPTNLKDPTGLFTTGDVDYDPGGFDISFYGMWATILPGLVKSGGSSWPNGYLPGFTDPAWRFNSSLQLDLNTVIGDVVFGYLAASPFPLPVPGLTDPRTWEAILAALRANPLTLLLFSVLVQTGGPPNFPKQKCPDKEHFWDPTKSPGKNWEWSGTGPVGSRECAWYNPITDESLHPGITHPPGKPPHWTRPVSHGSATRMAHISGLSNKMKQEIVATPLSIQQLWDSVSDIARFLASVGRGPFSVEYGWGCNVPASELWHPIEVTPAQLEEFVERSENEGSFKLGACDLIIRDQAATFSFMICHESDLHFTSSDQDSLEQVSTLWREKGFTVYVSPHDVKGHRDWKRIDQQVT